MATPLAEGLQQLGDLHEAHGHPRLADRSYRRAIEVLHAAGLAERKQAAIRAHRLQRRKRRAGRTGAA